METETDTHREVLETKTDRQTETEVLEVFLKVLEGQEQAGEGWGGGVRGKGGGGGGGGLRAWTILRGLHVWLARDAG